MARHDSVAAFVRGTAVAAAMLALGFVLACGDAQEEFAPEPTSTAGTPNITQAPTATPSPAALPSATVAPRATLTYTDPTYGYAFEYAATWYLSHPKETGGDLVLQSYDPATAPGIGGITKDKLKVAFWVATGVDIPLEQWLAEGKNSPGQISPPVVLSQDAVTVGGKQGLAEVVVSDGVKSVGYYAPIGNDRVFVVNAVPADSDVWAEFEGVLASITFAP